MMRRPVTILVFALVLLACGPSTRQQTLRTMLTATTAAQAGFISWNGSQLNHIAETAPSYEQGMAEIAELEKSVSPVVKGFEVVYRTIAAAALLDEDQKSLMSAIGAFEQLRLALKTLTKGALP
jgi:hypothetical protein